MAQMLCMKCTYQALAQVRLQPHLLTLAWWRNGAIPGIRRGWEQTGCKHPLTWGYVELYRVISGYVM